MRDTFKSTTQLGLTGSKETVDGNDLFTALEANDLLNILQDPAIHDGKRLAMILYETFINGKTQKEIAKDPTLNLGISRSMVSKLKTQAINILRSKLDMTRDKTGLWIIP